METIFWIIILVLLSVVVLPGAVISLRDPHQHKTLMLYAAPIVTIMLILMVLNKLGII